MHIQSYSLGLENYGDGQCSICMMYVLIDISLIGHFGGSLSQKHVLCSFMVVSVSFGPLIIEESTSGLNPKREGLQRVLLFLLSLDTGLGAQEGYLPTFGNSQPGGQVSERMCTISDLDLSLCSMQPL